MKVGRYLCSQDPDQVTVGSKVTRHLSKGTIRRQIRTVGNRSMREGEETGYGTGREELYSLIVMIP